MTRSVSPRRTATRSASLCSSRSRVFAEAELPSADVERDACEPRWPGRRFPLGQPFRRRPPACGTGQPLHPLTVQQADDFGFVGEHVPSFRSVAGTPTWRASRWSGCKSRRTFSFLEGLVLWARVRPVRCARRASWTRQALQRWAWQDPARGGAQAASGGRTPKVTFWIIRPPFTKCRPKWGQRKPHIMNPPIPRVKSGEDQMIRPSAPRSRGARGRRTAAPRRAARRATRASASHARRRRSRRTA